MNKYKSLMSNTLLFGLSTFGSKVLSFLLMRLITTYLPTDHLSTARFVTNISNLILPVMYLGIAEAVIRFAMDDSYQRGEVFSISINTVLGGYLVLWCFYPLVSSIEVIQGYVPLVYLYVLTSAMRTVVTNYVRASGHVRLFAMDGIFTTAMTLAGYIIFLVPLNMGIAGYVLATIVADGLSALGLFLILKLHRVYKFRGIDHITIYDMFRYALPLVPNAVFWWVINLSSSFFVNGICGAVINGMYNAAGTIPNLIMMVSAFFTRAWELSAFSEYNGEEGEKFFSTVFRNYYTFIFVVASGLILMIKPFTTILLHPSYFEAWRYGPLLILAVSFQCLVTFLGAVYNAHKRNAMVTITTFIGAAVNVVLNLLLIPKMGAQGAALSALVSYFTVFLIRAVDTRKYIRIQMQPLRIAINLALLLGQTWIALSEPKGWIVWELIVVGGILAINFGYILAMIQKLLGMLRPGKSKA